MSDDALESAGTSLADHGRQLQTLDGLAQRFGQSLSSALSGGATDGRQLSDTLDRVGSSLESALARSAAGAAASLGSGALTAATQALSGDWLSGSFGGALPFAMGGAISGGRVIPFASGGVVSTPSYFPLGDSLGVAGERGPEAIMPLARGSDGRLGVAGGAAPAGPVTVNIAAGDVESFRRSEAQVSAALARAVARGRRGL